MSSSDSKKKKKKPQEKLIKQIYSWHIKSTKKQNKKLKISRGEKKIISKEATVREVANSNNGNQRTMNCLISAKRKLLVQNSTSS